MCMRVRTQTETHTSFTAIAPFRAVALESALHYIAIPCKYVAVGPMAALCLLAPVSSSTRQCVSPSIVLWIGYAICSAKLPHKQACESIEVQPLVRLSLLPPFAVKSCRDATPVSVGAPERVHAKRTSYVHARASELARHTNSTRQSEQFLHSGQILWV